MISLCGIFCDVVSPLNHPVPVPEVRTVNRTPGLGLGFHLLRVIEQYWTLHLRRVTLRPRFGLLLLAHAWAVGRLRRCALTMRRWDIVGAWSGVCLVCRRGNRGNGGEIGWVRIAKARA